MSIFVCRAGVSVVFGYPGTQSLEAVPYFQYDFRDALDRRCKTTAIATIVYKRNGIGRRHGFFDPVEIFPKVYFPVVKYEPQRYPFTP